MFRPCFKMIDYNGSAGCPPPASSEVLGLISSSVHPMNDIEAAIAISKVKNAFFIVGEYLDFSISVFRFKLISQSWSNNYYFFD